MWTNAILGSFAFFAIVAWIGVEFLGLVLWLRKVLRRLGSAEDTHESVGMTVQHMEDWPYAATRNAKQDIERRL